MRTLIALLALALAGIAPLAGCGGGAKSTSSSQSSQPASSSTGTGTTGAGSTATAPTTSTPSSSAAIARALAECHAVVAAAPNLTPALKGKVEGICKKASNGDLAGARKAARQVCLEVVNAEPVPAAVKESARTQCNTI